MFLFARGAGVLRGAFYQHILHGLKLVAVVIVAQAVLGMARALCPDRARASIAAVAVLIILLSTTPMAQIAAILWGGLAGLWVCRSAGEPQRGGSVRLPVSKGVGVFALSAFFFLLLALPILSHLTRSANAVGASHGIALFDAFYRSGALVFGGGHVVLPLLREALVSPGWTSDDTFLAGYGAAQALPGPLFTFGAYLGAVADGPTHGLPGALLGLVGIFLPGVLILLGTLPFWGTLQERQAAQAVLRGVNAAVVGVLAAALYMPLWTSSVSAPTDFVIVVVGFVLIMAWRLPPLAVVIVTTLLAASLGAIYR
ncbi:MAG TPA: chromate efflux transporter [Steroidobacteraceae bacterium]|nr:chromate efflux transporter [Steroidobacteraceae bacterium]